MEPSILEREAARLGYRLIKAERIRELGINLVLDEFMPREVAQNYIDGYIRTKITQELYDKMAEYNKIGIVQQRYDARMMHFEISFRLEIIVPGAPEGRT